MIKSNYIEAPEIYIRGDLREDDAAEVSIFLAGGITGCPDWQEKAVRALTPKYVVLNPRCKDFPTHDPSAARTQIEWEFQHLRKADVILFWFPPETLCPIVLYGLGAWTVMQHKALVIGVDYDYARRQDVLIQTHLVRPKQTIYDTLEETIAAANDLV